MSILTDGPILLVKILFRHVEWSNEMKIAIRPVLILMYIVFLSRVSWGQENSTQKWSIKGTVTDADGAPLAFANVYLQESMEGTMSDDQGNFTFTSRGVGERTLVCSYIGYETFQTKLTLKEGEIIIRNIVLHQGAVKTRPIAVTASAFTAADEEGVTLTSMDVVRTPGAAADVFWAIKTFPGLQQVEEGAGLFVRGGDVAETAVYLDGALMKHPYKYESPTGGFFGTISPFLLKGIFFSSGGFSAQYGNGLSGVLSMESQDLPGRRQMGVGLGLAAESVYLAFPVVNDKFGFSLSGNRSNTRMMFELNNTRKDFSRYPFSFDFNLNAVYKMNNNNKLKFFFFREDDKIGVEIDDPDYSTHFHGNSSNQLFNLRFSSLVHKNVLVKANMAFNRFKRDMVLSVMDLDIDDRLYQVRLTGEGELFENFFFRTGLVLFRDEIFIRGTVPEEKLDLNPEAPVIRVETDYISNRAVQFFECETPGPLGIRITPGLRGEYESISKTYKIDPRISCIFPLTRHSNITAAWGLYHQYPEPRYFDPYVGNPLLSAMKATHYILGYAYQKKDVIFRLETYYKVYDSLLLEDDVLNYTNMGFGSAKGFDVFAKNSFGRISGWVAYSWLEARRKWMDLPVLISPYFDITHNLTAIINVDIASNLTLGTSFRYATGKPYTPASGATHRARVPDYQKMDVSLNYRYSFFESNMTVFYIAVANLLGRVNIFNYRYSSDWQRRDAVESSFRRSVYFGVSFNM